MKPVSEITAILIDTGGNYISIAQRLARDYKHVYYCTNWQTSFPKWNEYSIGLNVPNIERVDHWAECIDHCDLIVFPDLYQGAFQEWLVEHGKVVFGTRTGEAMEIYRDEFKEMLESVGLPVGNYKIINGYDKLEKFLHANPNQFVKTSIIRGNGETFKYIDQRLSESRLDELRHTLGAFKDEAIFVVEEPIPDAVEIGYDGFVIDGKYPAKCLVGIEIKDSGYAGCVVDYNNLPNVLKDINKKLAGIFAGAGYKCFFSNEIRWTGKKGYFIDSTNRCPQPPGDLQQEIYKDYSRYIWEIANGIVPEIESTAKYGAQIIIKSDWATTEPQAVYYPKKYTNRIKIKNLMYKGEIPYYIPCGYEMTEIGSVVGLGNSLKAAIDDAKMIAATVEGDGISVNGDALDDAAAEFKRLEEYNIKLI